MPQPSSPATASSRRHFLFLLPGLVAPLGGAAYAAAPASGPGQTLSGRAVDGQLRSLAALRGRVVLVFFWATDCAVCRDKMGELRANVGGWKGQPFSMLGVNMDRQRQDLVDYERLVATTLPKAPRLDSIWAGDADFRSSLGTPEHLPMAVLIDKQGQEVRRYSGRIPASAWDDIAELL
jgi:thiol-disulfide isomerase/thioredoxin